MCYVALCGTLRYFVFCLYLVVVYRHSYSHPLLYPLDSSAFDLGTVLLALLPWFVNTLFVISATRPSACFHAAKFCRPRFESEGKAIQTLAAFKVSVLRCQSTEDGEQVQLDLMLHLKVTAAISEKPNFINIPNYGR